MKAKVNIPDFSPLDQIRVKQQEEMKIKNHLKRDDFNIINPSQILINSNLNGKSWYLKDDSLKYIKVRIDLNIRISISTLYHCDIFPTKVTFLHPSDRPEFEDLVLNVNDLKNQSDEFILKNYSYTVSSIYFTDFTSHLDNAFFDIFHTLMDSKEDDNKITFMDVEDYLIEEKDYLPLEDDEVEQRAKKIIMKKQLIMQYNKIIKPLETNEILLQKQKEAMDYVYDDSKNKNKKPAYNQEMATNASFETNIESGE